MRGRKPGQLNSTPAVEDQTRARCVTCRKRRYIAFMKEVPGNTYAGYIDRYKCNDCIIEDTFNACVTYQDRKYYRTPDWDWYWWDDRRKKYIKDIYYWVDLDRLAGSYGK